MYEIEALAQQMKYKNVMSIETFRRNGDLCLILTIGFGISEIEGWLSKWMMRGSG